MLWMGASIPLVRSSQRREHCVLKFRDEGSPMFSSTIDITAWAVAFSFLVFVLAFFAEGRGMHLMRILLGLAPRKQGLEAFDSVPRDDGDWRVVSSLEEPQSRTRLPDTSADLDLRASGTSGAPA
jgi:hypothetical protein